MVCFRLDDPHARSNHALEASIFDIFRRFNLPLCIAVIPFNKGPGEDEIFPASQRTMPHVADGLQQRLLVLAQHGCDHIDASMGDSRTKSEFIGVRYSEQRERILMGREQLLEGFGQQVPGFVPPWNAFDKTTISILGELDFTFISASWHVPSGVPKAGLHGEVVVIIPRTCNLNTLEACIVQAKHFKSTSPVVVVVMHLEDFAEFRDPPGPGEAAPFTNLEQLQAILERLHSDPEVAMCSITDAAQEAKNGGNLRHISDSWWFGGIPCRYRHRFPVNILMRSRKGLLKGVLHRF